MPFVKGRGFVPGPDDTPTGRTAKPREQELGKGRPTPEKRQMPFARHMGLEILMGTPPDPPGDDTDTQGAIDSLLDAFSQWKSSSAAERYRVLEMRFEFVTEAKLVLYIIYSQ